MASEPVPRRRAATDRFDIWARLRRAGLRLGGTPVRLIYVSNGNIPSHWAHTLQIMKMSEALSRLVPGFVLLTATDLRGLLFRRRAIYRWYGVRRRFRLRRLLLRPRTAPGELQAANVRGFAELAARFIDRCRPDIVYTRNHETALLGLRQGYPVVFETHDGPGQPKTMRYIRQFAAFANLRGVVTTSPVLRDAFVEQGIPADRVVVWQNGVDLERFADMPQDPVTARGRLGWRADRPVVMYTGSLKPFKGIGTLLAAARLLTDVDVVIIGGTPEDIDQWRAAEPLPDNARFIPFTPNAELPRYLAAADVCVVPNSQMDRTAGWTFSLKLYEYLAARRPVVASNIPSLASVLTHEQTGLLVPPDDAAALAQAIRRLLGDRALASRLARAGNAQVRAMTWDQRARGIAERLFPDLIGSDS